MKFDKKLVDYVVTQLSGQECLKLVYYLKGKKNISEFIIAKALKQEINITRNQLYKLLDHHLITFIRKKDKEKGWYIYYWTFNLNQVPYAFWEIKKKRLSGLQDRFLRERHNTFFSCKNSCIRLVFETALTYSYRCPECGELLEQQQNESIIKDIEKEMHALELEIKSKKIAMK
jgi:transcription initiation factor TFIIE subunit alpha